MNITKQKLKDYFSENYDVTFDELIKDFELSKEQLKVLEDILNELIKEGIITKVYCEEHKTYEYDPAEK